MQDGELITILVLALIALTVLVACVMECVRSILADARRYAAATTAPEGVEISIASTTIVDQP